MSRKRRNTSSAEAESPPAKRRQSTLIHDELDDYPDSYEQPSVDPNFGQVGAFPGVAGDDGLFYGPAGDGLDYLRMVRSEAQGIPLFLTATRAEQTSSSNDKGHEGFFGEDEAFVAAPICSKELDTSFSEAQRLYYEAILARFDDLRAEMKTTPPLQLVQALPESMPISFPSSSRTARETWETYILQHAPHSVQIACMDSDSVLELIRLITRKMHKLVISASKEDTRRLGSWIWASLARCPDRGQLGSEEISDLRAYAKCAVARGQEDTSSDIEEEEDGSDLQMDKQDVIRETIITIVGETYGQRDLLELRRPWVALDEG